MNLQELTLAELKEIVSNGPLTEESYYDLRFGQWVFIAVVDGKERLLTHPNLARVYLSPDELVADYSFIKLSDIRAQIEKIEAEKDTNVTLSAESIENKGVDGSEKPVFKVGDRVVIVNPKAVSSLFEVVYSLSSGVRVKEINIIDYGMQFFEFHQIRHATPEEDAAGHRIDEPSAVETVTVKLDPAKCRIVDPALPYDEPTKRRVGWVGCLGGRVSDGEIFIDAAIHNALHGSKPEFPIDAELKPDSKPELGMREGFEAWNKSREWFRHYHGGKTDDEILSFDEETQRYHFTTQQQCWEAWQTRQAEIDHLKSVVSWMESANAAQVELNQEFKVERDELEQGIDTAYKEIAAAMRTSYSTFKTTADLHQQGRADGLEDALLILEMHFERLKGEQGE